VTARLRHHQYLDGTTHRGTTPAVPRRAIEGGDIGIVVGPKSGESPSLSCVGFERASSIYSQTCMTKSNGPSTSRKGRRSISRQLTVDRISVERRIGRSPRPLIVGFSPVLNLRPTATPSAAALRKRCT
jgi:hypothetical protein